MSDTFRRKQGEWHMRGSRSRRKKNLPWIAIVLLLVIGAAWAIVIASK